MTLRHIGCALLFITCATSATAGVFEVEIHGIRAPLPASYLHHPRPDSVPRPLPTQAEIATLRRKARAGDIDAQLEMADIQRYNYDGDPAHAREGIGWLLRAAKLGSIEAQRRLAWIFENKDDPNFDGVQALHWYTVLANNGDTGALETLAAWYRDGHFVTADLDKSLAYLTRAAELGGQRPQRDLVAFYMTDGPGRNEALAFKWRERLATEGDIESCRFLAGYYGAPGPHYDIQRAEPWYLCLANHGYTDAMVTLTDIYAADGPLHNDDKAYDWTVKAAEKFDQNAIARLCRYPENAETARYSEAMQACARVGPRSPADDAALGIAYFDGKGVAPDRTAALPLLVRAMTDGQPGAAAYVGRYIEAGLVSPDDAAILRRKMWISAAKGHAEPRAWLDAHPDSVSAKENELDLMRLPRGYTVLVTDADGHMRQMPFAEALYLNLQSAGPAYYPPRAGDDEVEGRIELACQWGNAGGITTCDIANEAPKGYGFAAESIKLLTRQPFTVSPAEGWQALSAGKWSFIRLRWILERNPA